jgi:hypothetical protein
MRFLALALVFLIASQSDAQLFWRSKASQDCPGGVCAVQSAPVAAVTRGRQVTRYRSVNDAALATMRTVQSQGSSGGEIFVGKVLSDGSVVSAIGSTQPMSAMATEMRAVPAASALNDRVAFRRELLAAAKAQRDSGEMNALTYYRIMARSRNPIWLQSAMETAQEVAAEEGMTAGAIDWKTIFEKLLPILLQIILDMLSSNGIAEPTIAEQEQALYAMLIEQTSAYPETHSYAVKWQPDTTNDRPNVAALASAVSEWIGYR